MKTHSLCTLRTGDGNRSMWWLFALITALGLICQAGYAQDCAQCATNALLQDPVVPTGEWLLTKQVSEVNVLFVAAHNGEPVADLSQNDIVVRDDGKAPKAILGFRNEQ